MVSKYKTLAGRKKKRHPKTTELNQAYTHSLFCNVLPATNFPSLKMRTFSSTGLYCMFAGDEVVNTYILLPAIEPTK
ncbi:MAG: hypothetical protein NVSMB7_15930 [Chitinophagaceae bacterium]